MEAPQKPGSGKVQRQETTRRPRDDEGRKFDDREGQQLPRDPEAEKNRLDVVPIELPEHELLFGRTTFV